MKEHISYFYTLFFVEKKQNFHLDYNELDLSLALIIQVDTGYSHPIHCLCISLLYFFPWERYDKHWNANAIIHIYIAQKYACMIIHINNAKRVTPTMHPTYKRSPVPNANNVYKNATRYFSLKSAKVVSRIQRSI